jgi:membrane protein
MIEGIIRKLFKYFIDRAKHLVLPGFDRTPLYEVMVFFWHGLLNGAINLRASAFSFNFFLSLFPAAIVAFTLIPYVPIPHFQDAFLMLIRDLIPDQVYQAVETTLLDIVNRPRGGLMSLGFVLALFFATSGANSLIDAFNQTVHEMETRSFVKQQVIAVVLVLIVSVIVGVAIVLSTLGPHLLHYLAVQGILRSVVAVYLISSLRWLIIAVMLLFAFSFLYYLAPAGRNKFRFISAGSMLSTLLTILASIAFNYYVNNFSRYNTLYGSIGTLMIIMIWINFNALAVIIGFELNASIRGAKKRIEERGTNKVFGQTNKGRKMIL